MKDKKPLPTCCEYHKIDCENGKKCPAKMPSDFVLMVLVMLGLATIIGIVFFHVLLPDLACYLCEKS